MKKSIYGGVLLIALAFGFTSCESEDVKLTEEVGLEEVNKDLLLDEYRNSKDVVVNSKDGSSAVVRIYSNQNGILEQYSEKNFYLVPMNTGETINEALLRANVITEEKESGTDYDNDDYDERSSESTKAFRLVEIKNSNADRYALHVIDIENQYYRGWNYDYFYGALNSDQNAQISRHSKLKRVYFGLQYKAYSSSPWSTIQSEFYKLSKNQSKSYSRTPCYQFRFNVKYRKSSNFSVSFSG